MKKKIRHTDEPIELKVTKDFLPPPEELISREDMAREEDKYFVKIAEERMKTYNKEKALTHEQVWGKRPAKKKGMKRKVK
jgi:hypothetical protein